jgi:hypothetical protein
MAIITNLPSLALQKVGQTNLAESTKPPLLLVTMVPDDSGSIATYNNVNAICRGHNAQLDIYREASPETITIQAKTRYLNGSVLFGYAPPKDAVPMSAKNYSPNFQTPLYRQTLITLDEVSCSAASFEDRFDVFTMTCILTDGADNDSGDVRASHVRTVVENMISSGRHIVMGIGVRDKSTDFAKVFSEMGIPERWISVLEREEESIVRGMAAVATVSRTITDRHSFIETSRSGFGPARGPDTAIPGRNTIAHMMGAYDRSPAERGLVAVDQLSWRPTSGTFVCDGSSWKRSEAWPITWDEKVGLYSLMLPSKNTWIILGRYTDEPFNSEAQAAIDAVVRDFQSKGISGKIVYVPLMEKVFGQEPRLSCAHTLITPQGEGQYRITSLKGDLALMGDTPSEDQYVQSGGQSEWLDYGKMIRLAADNKTTGASAIVFRVV